ARAPSGAGPRGPAAPGCPRGGSPPPPLPPPTLAATGPGAARPGGRPRLGRALPWLLGAAPWIVLSPLPLAWFKPSWGSFRAVIPIAGLGLAWMALLRSAGAWAVVSASVVRLAPLLFLPAISGPIPLTLEGTNVEFDRPGLASLQRLTPEGRVTMRAARPQLPHGARVVRFQWPRMSSLAFVDPKAFRVWYRDSSLRVVSMGELTAHPDARVDVAIGFEPRRSPQVVMIAPRALTEMLLAADSLRLGRAAAAEALLRDFEQQQPDTNAAMFLATGVSLRGASLLELQRTAEARALLGRALALNPDDGNAHRLLAEAYRRDARPDLEALELERHLRLVPDDEEARRRLSELAGGKR